MNTPASYDPHAPNADPSVPINTPTPIDGQIILVDYDRAWPGMYAREKARIRSALGDRALRIEHIGSTSVPGLCAKPCIDILLAVADSSDESSYVPDLEAAGYVLRRREPEWHEHRVFKGREVNLNLHVWTLGDTIIDKHIGFRNWLRTHLEDRERYAEEKKRLASMHWHTMNDYANAKDEIVREIEQRMKLAGP
jgi:GrpB-like predicted nucleotidyltransferase (UPF0157 family)